MANSKYEYVRTFERDEILLPNTWIVVRIDGRGFHYLSNHYHFAKPNDASALDLMNAAAAAVVKSIPEICIAYGVSDEYSFVFPRTTELFERRTSKLVTTVVSTFTAYYVHLWSSYRKDHPLLPPWMPTFDGRAVCYPSTANLKDYLTWRQVDCHINNLYNTTFWALVQIGGINTQDAEEQLKGTVAADKNEILFSQFGINYNKEPEMYKKGSVVFREYELEPLPHPQPEQSSQSSQTTLPDRTIPPGQISAQGPAINTTNDDDKSTNLSPPSKPQLQKHKKRKSKAEVVIRHIDIIKDDFWDQRPWILSGGVGRLGT